MTQPVPEKPVVAVCGKGGAGKTVVSALLARALRDAGTRPLLLVDADPVCGLLSALGERADQTLGAVRERVIAAARDSDEDARRRVADQLDYLVLEAMIEHDDHALLAMGRSSARGCYCPVNALLRDAIDLVSGPFAAVLIDAEAGLEQVNRRVTRCVTKTLVVTDGSRRSRETLALIAEMVGPDAVAALANRCPSGKAPPAPAGVAWLGVFPEDETVRRFDREGRSLWELPADNAALAAARAVAAALGITR